MSERDGYNPGEFCWVDLAVPDPGAAAAFYGDLMGWQARSAGPVEESGGYGFFEYKGKMVAGFGPTQSAHQPPAWSSYVTVADIDDTVAKVPEAGGNVALDPIDLPQESGRMAVFQDSEGAFISVIQPGTHAGAELVNEVGAWTWNNLSTRDLEKARSFYGHVFGWRAERSPLAPADLPYLMWHGVGEKFDEGLAGLNIMGDEIPLGVPPHWMVYFAVEDAEAVVEKTLAAGGELTAPVIEVPSGRFAILVDPQGARFGALQPNNPDER
jgi:uncharacterized protein